jgi:YihY family inner membrane protein
MHKRLANWFEIAKETAVSFRKDDGMTLAAALSFYSILSLIPLSMIVVSILGHIIGQSDEALGRIMEAMTEVIPTLSPRFLHEISNIINRKVTSGWIGIVVLFFVASVLFTNLEKTLDKIFKALRSRNFFHSRLLSIAFIFVTALLLFVPAVLKTVDLALNHYHIPITLGFLIRGDLFFMLVSWFGFVLVVSVVPNHEVRFKYNLIGGGVFAILLMLAKYLFRWYTAFSLPRLNLVYGALTSLVLIILWIFYFITLLLLCAELVGILQGRGTEEEEKPSQE